MIFQFWGATAEEINSSVVGDNLFRDASLTATRSITINAVPNDVFPWIRQMGFGRAGWYSYDWLLADIQERYAGWFAPHVARLIKQSRH